MRRILFSLAILVAFVPTLVSAQGQGQGQGRGTGQGTGRGTGQGQGQGQGQNAGEKKKEAEQLHNEMKKIQEQIKQHELALKSARQRKDEIAITKEQNDIKQLRTQLQQLQQKAKGPKKG